MQEESKTIYLNVLTAPDDMWPCPPNDMAILEALAKYLAGQGVGKTCEDGIAIRPDEGVVFLTLDDAEDICGEELEGDCPSSDAPYRCMVQLAMFMRAKGGGQTPDDAEDTAKCLINAWNQAHMDGLLPMAHTVSWNVDKVGRGFVELDADEY